MKEQSNIRASLINLVNGGNGIVESWIEAVHYKADEQHPEDYIGYCYHLHLGGAKPAGKGQELVLYCNLETCRNLRIMEEQITHTDEEAREIAANMPIIDNGRYYNE